MFNNGSQKPAQPYIVSAARRNGLMAYLDHLLSTLGRWNTYAQVETPEDLLKTVSQTSGKFLGLDFFMGDKGGLKIKTIVVALMAVHTLEQISGGLISLTSRLFIKGRVLGSYGGIVIRHNPLTAKKAAVLNFVTRGWILPHAIGVYFYEGGRTWEIETFGIDSKICTRAMTRVSSFGVPRREHFFDRPIVVPSVSGLGTLGNDIQIGADAAVRNVPIQALINVIVGREHPANIPGYIGSTNELENVVGALGWAKRLLFMASWFLVDEAERDLPLQNLVDYSTLNPGLLDNSKQAQPAASPYWRYPGASGTKAGVPPVWPSVRTAGAPPTPQAQPARAVQLSFEAQFDPTAKTPPPASPEDGPYYRIRDRITLGGKYYPVLIKGRATNPMTMVGIVDAIYYDPADRSWKPVTDGGVLNWLDNQLQTGQMAIATDWQYQM